MCRRRMRKCSQRRVRDRRLRVWREANLRHVRLSLCQRSLATATMRIPRRRKHSTQSPRRRLSDRVENLGIGVLKNAAKVGRKLKRRRLIDCGFVNLRR